MTRPVHSDDVTRGDDAERVRYSEGALWPILRVSSFTEWIAQRRAGAIESAQERRLRRGQRPEVCQVCLGGGVRVVWTFSKNGRGFGREIPCPSCMGRKGDGAFGVLHPVG